MVRDASHQPISPKFSFIETLDLSKGGQQDSTQVATEEKTPASAIVTTSNEAATIDTNWYESNDSYELNLAEAIEYSATENLADRSFKHRSYLGKILFALSCSYCLFVLWWLFGDRASQMLTGLTGAKRIDLSKSDVEFIDYMERSLDKIDRQLEANRSQEDDSVVYIPVYTPTPATMPQVSSGNLPLTTLPNNGIPTIPQPMATANASTPTLKIPAPPPLPAPNPLETNSSVSSDEIASSNVEPTVKHTLTGILELGEGKSAALVKVNGKTKRVWLGEEINNSGWILESLTNQTAKISDRGQVRSIDVGETF